MFRRYGHVIKGGEGESFRDIETVTNKTFWNEEMCDAR